MPAPTHAPTPYTLSPSGTIIRAIETLVAELEHAHGPLPDDHRAKVALANARRAGK